MEGPFDFNRTPISILGTKSIAYLDPANHASWQPHGIDCWYTARCPMHYRQLEFFDPITRAYRTTATYELFPAHCKVPTVSEEDKTLIAATELLEVMKANVPTQADLKCRHAKSIDDLILILENRPEPRVDTSQPQRVVDYVTTSTNATSPRVIAATKYVHQRRTRSNNPMPTILENDEGAESNADILTKGMNKPVNS